VLQLVEVGVDLIQSCFYPLLESRNLFLDILHANGQGLPVGSYDFL